jgi:hypothetical protein
MKQYSSFLFDSHSFDPATGKIALNYALDDDLKFTETLTLPQPIPKPSSSAFERALHALHLIGGMSYYKTCVPKTMEIRTTSLSNEQAAFWNEVYENGLGEFFFKNEIDFRGLIQFPSGAAKPFEGKQPKEGKKLLVPIGGGKDSIVTIKLLQNAGCDITLLRVGGHPVIDRIAGELGLPLLTVKRELSPLLFRLNAEGALNGHVPITAYLSFLALAVAELHGFDAVVMSNERSANVGNVEFHGKEINHQWSKSLVFERMLRDYAAQWIGTGVEYFSLLRPWSELRITQQFVTDPSFLPLTTSCNANWRILKEKPKELWCGQCPKCAFVFTLYAAFLPKDTVVQTFGKDLFTDPNLLPLYKQLLGAEGFKPFECVGTHEETAAAFLLARDHGEWNGSAAMELFERDVLPTIKDPKRLIADALAPSSDHCVPAPFERLTATR